MIAFVSSLTEEYDDGVVVVVATSGDEEVTDVKGDEVVDEASESFIPEVPELATTDVGGIPVLYHNHN